MADSVPFSMDKSTRGRARGRVRQTEQAHPGSSSGSAPPAAQQQQRPAAGHLQPQSFVAPPLVKSAWGQGAAVQQQQPRAAAPARITAVGRAQVRGPTAEGPSRKAVTMKVAVGGSESHSGRCPIFEASASTLLAQVGKQGTSGTKLVLQTNYFRLEKRADWCIYQYHVDFQPAIDDSKAKRKLFDIATQAMNLKGIFDGTTMFSPFRLSPGPKEFVVDDLVDSTQKVHIYVRMVGVIEKSSYHYLQVYNLIMRKCMRHLKLQLVGRNYYDPGNKITVAKLNIELWPGVLSSVRQLESDVLMCAEIKHKVMRTVTALDRYRGELENPHSNSQADANFADKMLNVIVITEYNNKTYRIDDVDFTSSPATTFEKADGSKCSFADYYKTRYGITIRNMTQPMLVSQSNERDLRAGAKEIVHLVPELCRITGLTPQERANRTMMAKIADYMRLTPQSRIKSLNHFNKRLQSTPECVTELKQWDLALSKEIISLSGRQLPVEELRCNNAMYSATAEADWTRNMRSRGLFRNGDLSAWAIIYCRCDEMDVKSFYGHIKKAAYGMLWRIASPIFKQIDNLNAQSYHRAVEDVLAQQPNVKLIFVGLPANRPGASSDLYDSVKKKLTVEKGIPSQMVTQSTMSHKNAFSIATKVVVQMNCKVGGAPWAIKVPFKNWMVCGYDACHDRKGKNKSYGAFVASYDAGLTAYYNTVAHHKDGEELSNFIGVSIGKALVFYVKANKMLPDKILFYRDGIGDGQVNHVYDTELKTLNETLQSIYAPLGKKVGMRFIIVNKRINTRFFLNGGNPGPGTIVDDVVTHPDRTDFFLIPQCTRQGTVVPTYYNVLGPDEFGLDMDKTQVLTNRLCHQYYNWSGTVRVPAPCQYAHKLAFLAAQNLQRTPNENLNHLLHFL